MKELIYRTPYWRIRFLDISSNVHLGGFESKRKEIKYISNYWNNSYSVYYDGQVKQKCHEEFMTDERPNKYHIIFRDLKMLKMFNFIFNNNEVRLIRRNYADPYSLALTKRFEKQHQDNTTE